MTREINNDQDCLDIRDIIERFDELDDERTELCDELEEAEANDIQTEDDDVEKAELAKLAEEKRQAVKEWDDENGEEHKTLKELLDELEGNGGDHQWRGSWYPVSLIRDSYFVEAMRELVQDIGGLPKDIPGYLAIDWDKTAENLRADYSSVEFGGVTYWYR